MQVISNESGLDSYIGDMGDDGRRIPRGMNEDEAMTEVSYDSATLHVYTGRSRKGTDPQIGEP
jgi:hypothetical protein